ncbi:hypothetical protein KM043_009705 [Ampulex compressa]|nr:hypothetical protein KM043_009705 [Ampulex compressa]
MGAYGRLFLGSPNIRSSHRLIENTHAPRPLDGQSEYLARERSGARGHSLQRIPSKFAQDDRVLPEATEISGPYRRGENRGGFFSQVVVGQHGEAGAILMATPEGKGERARQRAKERRAAAKSFGTASRRARRIFYPRKNIRPKSVEGPFRRARN